MRLPVTEVRAMEKRIAISKLALPNTLHQSERDTLEKSAPFCVTWLPDLDSNQGPAD